MVKAVMKEKDLLSYAMGRLAQENSWLDYDRANSGKFSAIDKFGKKRFIRGKKAGTPDIEGFCAPHGRYFGMELKVGDNEQTDQQKERQRRIEQLGGLYFLCFTPEHINGAILSLRANGIFTPATSYLKTVSPTELLKAPI